MKLSVDPVDWLMVAGLAMLGLGLFLLGGLGLSLTVVGALLVIFALLALGAAYARLR